MVFMFIVICFSFGSVILKDFQILMIIWFFGVFFVFVLVMNIGGVFGDLFFLVYCGIVMVGYVMVVVGGFFLGEFVLYFVSL